MAELSDLEFTMTFPRYPKYKPSGVEWLGEVPEHWDVTQIKRIVSADRQITYGIVQAGPHVPDGVPYIRPADMTDEEGVLSAEDVQRTSVEIAANYARSTISEGDLVCSIGPSFGKVMITPQWLEGANLTQGTARIAIGEPNLAAFFFWVLRSGPSFAQWESSVGGATFRALNLGPLAQTEVAIPPPGEQVSIRDFLDHETARIDALVAEQRRLMGLLKEKRQAVISHAVTKGLDPNVPMKDSGIEWLGEVPAHWEVKTLKRVITSMEQGWSPQCENYPVENDNEWGVLKVGCVNGGSFNSAENKQLPSELEPIQDLSLRAGDLLISRANTLELVGSAAVVDKDYPKLLLCDKLYRLRFLGDINPYFISYCLGADLLRDRIKMQATGASASMLNIGQGAISELSFAVPSTGEQDGIVRHIEDELTRLNNLVEESQRAIDLLLERRTALISAAVTGQIDVRNAA